jgi:hypothetical protein
MKYSQWIGVGAALLIIIACFAPWAYFPDLREDFTGFFSEQNRYGRPGKVLVVFAGVEILLFLVPRVWAKRANLFSAAVTLAWSIKSYMLYTACYKGICPQGRVGIFLVLGGAAVVLGASLLPDLSVPDEKVSD